MRETIITTIIVVLVVGLTYLFKVTVNFLNAKINALKNYDRLKDNEIAQIGFETAEAAIKTVTEASVGKLEEIYAKELREKIADGQANKEELYALAGEAYNEIIATVHPELIKALEGGIQDAPLYIKNQIETQLLLLKARLSGGAVYEQWQ